MSKHIPEEKGTAFGQVEAHHCAIGIETRSEGLGRRGVLLRLMHDDIVRHRHLRALLALRVVGLQDLDLAA